MLAAPLSDAWLPPTAPLAWRRAGHAATGPSGGGLSDLSADEDEFDASAGEIHPPAAGASTLPSAAGQGRLDAQQELLAHFGGDSPWVSPESTPSWLAGYTILPGNTGQQ
jgi:hypothetical protein